MCQLEGAQHTFLNRSYGAAPVISSPSKKTGRHSVDNDRNNVEKRCFAAPLGPIRPVIVPVEFEDNIIDGSYTVKRFTDIINGQHDRLQLSPEFNSGPQKLLY